MCGVSTKRNWFSLVVTGSHNWMSYETYIEIKCIFICGRGRFWHRNKRNAILAVHTSKAKLFVSRWVQVSDLVSWKIHITTFNENTGKSAYRIASLHSLGTHHFALKALYIESTRNKYINKKPCQQALLNKFLNRPPANPSFISHACKNGTPPHTYTTIVATAE